MTDGDHTSSGEHSGIYRTVESVCCTPENNKMLFINYSWIIFLKRMVTAYIDGVVWNSTTSTDARKKHNSTSVFCFHIKNDLQSDKE